MKVLKVIHGYPPLYNAGSEVYSQLLCHGLAKNHEIQVFTREENPFVKDFNLREAYDALQPSIKLNLINIPLEKFRIRYQHPQVDLIFMELLQRIKPDIVHIGHLSHLSTSLVYEISKLKIPMVYTLHDYWLMCPRGQFIQRNPPKNAELWALCDGQENQKCAKNCYAGNFSGAEHEYALEVKYWSDWVDRRMNHIQEIVQLVNCFIAPSKYLYNRYVQEFKLPESKMKYLDYGFDLQRLKHRQRVANQTFTFGYIGTHIPAKGIQHLIDAFSLLEGDCQLRIWGRPRAQNTDGLQRLVANLPRSKQEKIQWLSEYQNENIVAEVFNHVDCIVVPSIWVENSPLVIHEALQVRIPVITANVGGMAEYVQHEKNGLLFQHRDISSLALQMQRLISEPSLAKELGAKGYLQSRDGSIQSQEFHVAAMEEIYRDIMVLS